VTDQKEKDLKLLIFGLLACDIAQHHVGPIVPVTPSVGVGLGYEKRTVETWDVGVTCAGVVCMGPGVELDMTAIGIPNTATTIVYTAPGKPDYSPHPPVPYYVKDGAPEKMRMTTTAESVCFLSIMMITLLIKNGGSYSGGTLPYHVTFTSGAVCHEMPEFGVDPTDPKEQTGFRWESLSNSLLAAIDPAHLDPDV
jgi:hypothetical protein